jgi:predicted metal-dependent hydrolase
MGAGGGLWYVQHLKAENEILTLNNAKLEGAVAEQQALIEQQLRDIETQQSINKQLTENNVKLTADLNLANEKFNKVNASGERRDIGNLAVSKPKSIERIERKR